MKIRFITVAIVPIALVALYAYHVSGQEEIRLGKPVRILTLSEEALSVMHQFQQGLKECEWEKVLSHCSESVITKAKEYESTEAFFRDVVPIETIVQTSEFRIFPVKGSPNSFYCVFDWHFRTSDPEMEHRTGWQPHMYKTDTGWLVDFRTKPLKLSIERYKQSVLRSRRIAKEYQARQKALEPKLKGIKTRLTPVSKEFVLGQPMLFRLELINGGEAELLYDDQQVDVNDSMIITDENENRIPYIAGPVQTGGYLRPIKPGESVILFDEFDMNKQYDIKKPGMFKVQFSGRGLHIGESRSEEDSLWDYDNFIGTEKRFPSNVVEIEITPNTLE